MSAVDDIAGVIPIVVIGGVATKMTQSMFSKSPSPYATKRKRRKTRKGKR